MANLKEQENWEDGVYQIEENDPVLGGENGITNKPLKQLANRTKYLKAEIEKRYIAQDASTEQKGLVQLDSSTDSDAEDKAATPKAVNAVKLLVNAVRSALSNYIPNSKKSNADNSSSSDTIATSYALKKVRDIATTRATDAVAGQTVLSHKINGTDKTKAATEFALNELNKELAGKGVPIGAVVSFPRAVTNPVGFLKANGTTFNQQTFPDLYRTLGNSNQLPDLTRSDVGMTAYFAVDNIPAGWIAFDEIATQVTEQRYPELYRHLIDKYGSINSVPKVADRFLRNAGNGLSVGQIQEDELKRHVHRVPIDYDSWFNHSSQGRNNSYFDYTTFAQSSDLWSTLGYDNADGDNGFVSPKDTSQMATGGDETRPKSLVLKLCIKALNSFDDVVFWIKSHGEVTNAGTLDAGRLAQDIQQLSAKTQQIERQSNQNEKLSLELKNQLSQIKNKEPTSRKIWQGNVTNGSGVLTLSESIINKNLVFYLQPSSGHTLSNNDVNTVSCYIDSTLPDVRRTRFAFTAYWDGGLRNFKIEIVSEKQIKLIDASSFYLKMITASD
ncbi:TPA: phage tail protein [Haemophilus influenzae]|uniref:phage tail protein n=1 Tax=Haemophilus influenzae TaxID=727 RepID=UPI0005FCB40B|nr:phage tail protein [Haemophilus influenzae]AKA47122.1 tail fiber protein [Haemophilus influenzae 2019]AWP55188.1 phage tail protein [Haemophilus influenzae]KKZ20492.1 tail fiber protein [Haemophilus influenzae 2019]MCK8943167.1 phage tail protein [Haemophilus influenzae]MCK8947691.1 phage tail protein [Haemophilus influenzae]